MFNHTDIRGYHIQRVLHAGRNNVYKVSIQGKVFALKELVHKKPPVLVTEVDIARRIQHPNIIHIVDVFIDSSMRESGSFATYLLLPYISGRLTKQLRESELSGQTKIQYIWQLVDAVACLHEAGIVHKDIKPGNLLVQDNNLILIDFDVAGYTGTQIENTIGTDGYIIPLNLFNSGTLTVEAKDIWAAGNTIYRILTGQGIEIGNKNDLTQPQRTLQLVPPIWRPLLTAMLSVNLEHYKDMTVIRDKFFRDALPCFIYKDAYEISYPITEPTEILYKELLRILALYKASIKAGLLAIDIFYRAFNVIRPTAKSSEYTNACMRLANSLLERDHTPLQATTVYLMWHITIALDGFLYISNVFTASRTIKELFLYMQYLSPQHYFQLDRTWQSWSGPVDLHLETDTSFTALHLKAKGIKSL